MLRLFACTILMILCILSSGCISFEKKNYLSTEVFLSSLEANSLELIPLPNQSELDLLLPESNELKLFGVYQSSDSKFSIYELSHIQQYFVDQNSSIRLLQNKNLLLVSIQPLDVDIEKIFLSLKAPLSIYDAGLFIYPLGLCLGLSIFIFFERFFSLRRSLTFPRKVEKALRDGEFPNKKWKQYSAAERIVWVAVNEKPSSESLKSYSNLEITALERGIFILEVIVAGAPLIGLLGTVTGLVQVFSVMPSIAESKEVLSEGIGLALFTTILGLAIAIPTLIGHAYLLRLVEKRKVSLNWVTSRINDAIHPKQDSLFD